MISKVPGSRNACNQTFASQFCFRYSFLKFEYTHRIHQERFQRMNPLKSSDVPYMVAVMIGIAIKSIPWTQPIQNRPMIVTRWKQMSHLHEYFDRGRAVRRSCDRACRFVRGVWHHFDSARLRRFEPSQIRLFATPVCRSGAGKILSQARVVTKQWRISYLPIGHGKAEGRSSENMHPFKPCRPDLNHVQLAQMNCGELFSFGSQRLACSSSSATQVQNTIEIASLTAVF